MPAHAAEVRHLLRKHVFVTTVVGLAQLVTCMECRRVGADTAANITHSTKCRLASTLTALGEVVKTGSRSASLNKTTPTTGAEGEIKKPKQHDPVKEALECTS